MTFTSFIPIRSINMTAVLSGIAVIVVFSIIGVRSSNAAEAHSSVLAAELLIVRDDLSRFMDGVNFPPAHMRGLQNRITGSLGILPWLLRQAGDAPGADQVRAFNLTPHPHNIALIKVLDQLIERHPLDLSPYAAEHLTPKLRREAFAIHDVYCAGCHDDAGQGDDDTELPARDLFLMARTSSPETFLARLINGVKGDETLLFTNPLSPNQVSSLWHHYRKHQR